MNSRKHINIFSVTLILPLILFSNLIQAQIARKNYLPETTSAELIQNRIYRFSDVSGSYQLILKEKESNLKGRLNHQISAICIQDGVNNFPRWSVMDSLQSKLNENSIRIWREYCSLTDIDGDKKIDPILVYFTRDDEGYKRITILTFWKNRKYSIKATECIVDDCRSFKTDPISKNLPLKLRNYHQRLLQVMRQKEELLLKNH